MIVSEQFFQLLVMITSGIVVGFIIDSVRLVGIFYTKAITPPKVDDVRRATNMDCARRHDVLFIILVEKWCVAGV